MMEKLSILNIEKSKKKTLKEYRATISKYKKEKSFLESQINDLKMTLKINQNLLYDILTKSDKDNEGIKKLIEKSKSITKKNCFLIDEMNIKFKILNLEKIIEEIPITIREEINSLLWKNNNKKKELISLDNNIKKLKLELEKVRKNAFFKTARTEVYVSEPTKISLEKNQTLINSKIIVSKSSKIHLNNKKKSEKLEKEGKNLKSEMINLKKQAINLKNKSPNPFLTEIQFLSDLGYNQTIEDEEFCEEEEENEESDSSEDIDKKNIEEKNKNNKQNELANLKDEYYKLKNKYKECQNTINKYKEKYKGFKGKMDSIRIQNYK